MMVNALVQVFAFREALVDLGLEKAGGAKGSPWVSLSIDALEPVSYGPSSITIVLQRLCVAQLVG